MKVCIDPGHGGYDPGAVGNGLQEKDLTLDIALRLKPILEYNGITTILTRDGDYVPGQVANLNNDLAARVQIAEEAKVDLFVCVHINAGGGTGVEILIIGTGGRAETAAQKVLPYLVQAGSWANRGVKTQNVYVLRKTSMPAILTENGFVDNQADSVKLKDPSFRQTLAVAHAEGICAFFGVDYKEFIPGQTIPNTTPKTPIMGTETIKVEQCRQFLLRFNPNAPDIIPFYKRLGDRLGIKWGYAVAQMINETGYLKFTGDVKAEQNNFAGIGAIGGGAQGAAFSTQEEGVLAHLEHLYAYATVESLPIGILKVDPRFDLVQRGSCPNWEDLNGHWAVPGDNYGQGIVKIYQAMEKEVISPEADTTLFRSIFKMIADYFSGN